MSAIATRFLNLPLVFLIPESEGLPPIGATIYLEWDVPDHGDPQGWYLATVTDHQPDGQSHILYPNGQSEQLCLKSTKWHLTRKGGRHYLPKAATLPKYPLKKLREETSKIKFYQSDSHSGKAFADDLTVLSQRLCEHQEALMKIDSCCTDLDLELRPDKCVTISYNGTEMVQDATIKLSKGSTRNITSGSTKFLGHLLGESLQVSRHAGSEKIRKKVKEALRLIEQRPVRGEYKVWIYKNYLAPSLFFLLAVDAIPESTIKSLQNSATRFIKKWLNLPRCATPAAIFHPEVLNLPFLPHLRERAKLAFVSQIEASKDPYIRQALDILNLPEYRNAQSIPPCVISTLQAAKQSISSITPRMSIKKTAKILLKDHHIQQWNSALDQLTVQSKFKDVVMLEEENKTWNRLLTALPVGQLSFILRAGMDCLPTPLNLRRLRYQVDSACQLCGSSRPTTLHILNGCPEALNQGRLSWRHDSVLNCLKYSRTKHVSENTTIFSRSPWPSC